MISTGSAHQVIYSAMRTIYDRGDPVDGVSLVEELERRNQFKEIGGDETLLEIANAAPHAANCLYHAQVVKQKSIARQAIQIHTDSIREGFSNLFTPAESLERAINRFSALIEGESAPTRDGIRDFPDQPGEAAFHGVMGEIVHELDPYTEANLAAILMQLLVGFGNMVGSGPTGSTRPTSIV